MNELVAGTGASEIEVAARLVELRIADSTIEVAGRLGCEPGATLDVRVRMAADRAAVAVWVLVADGLRGSERAKPLDRDDTPKMHRHVSLHAHREQARQTLDGCWLSTPAEAEPSNKCRSHWLNARWVTWRRERLVTSSPHVPPPRR